MSRTARFFEIIQILRAAPAPVRARDLADTLEVSMRTVYRDIAILQARQVPILGEAGTGYVMRAGYDLPPLTFDVDEAEAIAVGLSMIARTGDAGLWRAANRAHRKLAQVAPGTRHLVASAWGVEDTGQTDPGLIRRAIRDEAKLDLVYDDQNGAQTRRRVWPLALIYYADTVMIVAWCELRTALRHFRLDRTRDAALTAEYFKGQGAALLKHWEETEKDKTVTTLAL